MGFDLLSTVVVVGLAVLVGLAVVVGDASARSSAWRRIAAGRRELHEQERYLLDQDSMLRCADCPLGPGRGGRW